MLRDYITDYIHSARLISSSSILPYLLIMDCHLKNGDGPSIFEYPVVVHSLQIQWLIVTRVPVCSGEIVPGRIVRFAASKLNRGRNE